VARRLRSVRRLHRAAEQARADLLQRQVVVRRRGATICSSPE
jgi:hypothetical protein